MASFINLLGQDVWTEADIINRTESMIASEFSKDAVAILNRKATAALLGQYVLSEAEQGEIGRYAQVCNAAKEAGDVARKDMALLQGALDVEAAQRRLEAPRVTEPATVTTLSLEGEEVVMPNPAVLQDAEERLAAQGILDATTEEVLALVEARRPPVAEPQGDPEWSSTLTE